MIAITTNTRYDTHKRFRNADGLSDINQAISIKTSELNTATRLLNEAMAAITACGNSSTGCLSKTGRHISTWRDQRDRNSALVTQYKKELSELLVLQKELAGTQTTSAAATTAAAAAKTAIVEADTAQTTSAAKKWLVYGGIAVGVIAVIIIGIVLVKKYKK